MNSAAKKSRELQILLSASVALVLALIPLTGYIFDVQELVTLLISKQPMVLSTAVAIIIASTSLAAYSYFSTSTFKLWLNIAGVLLIAVALIVILETVFGQNWLDFPMLHQQIASEYPGRMSVNTAICTFLIGICFIVIGRPDNKALGFVIGLSISLVISIALFGLIGYFANFEFLATFGQTNKMAVPTALAYIALAIGTFLLTKKEDIPEADINLQKIYFTLEYLLVLVVVIVALASFASSQQRAESLLSKELSQTSEQSRLYFDDVIKLKINMAIMTSKRLEIIETLNMPAATGNINALFKDLEKYGYLQINLYQTNNTRVFSAGHYIRPTQSIKISDYDDIFLEWANGYQLRQISKISDRQQHIGYMESVISLTELTKFQQTVIRKTGTSDMVICGLKNNYQLCYPFRWNAKPASYYGYPNGKALPVTIGALGMVETSIMTDFRNECVMASVGPIGSTGLGMALKIDMRELYEPIRKQFYASFPLFILFIIGSIGLMRFKLKPLLDDLEKSRQRMQHLSMHDTLTLLANKSLFNDRLLQAVARLSRTNKQLALLYLDIDFFKRINDTYGHLIGDQLLIWFADTLKSCVRETDTVARIGGDEFAIILENPGSQQNIEHIAEKIIARVQQKLDLFPHGPIRAISTSIGIAVTDMHNVTPEELMQHADKALYQAKHRGRNTYSILNLDEID
jgi:diguanylate cyclase (GGDEF)-like protein